MTRPGRALAGDPAREPMNPGSRKSPAERAADELLQSLERQVANPAPARVLVGFSGGLDSSVLLTALTRLAGGPRLEAVHIDHGWHAESAAWAAHCEAAAGALGVRCTVRRVDAAPAPGQSREAAAREARYAVFESLLGDNDLLLTAHHADDQLETLLLRLVRGTGVRGLRAIHREATLGRGRLLRPLLDRTRSELERVAAHWDVPVLDDPSNSDLSIDRNHIRARVLPALVERWPAAPQLAARAAAHMQSAAELLDALARIDAGEDVEYDRFPLVRLDPLVPSRRANLLGFLLRQVGLPAPDQRQLDELVRQLERAPDAAIHVGWRGGEARSYRARLYLQPPFDMAARHGPVGTVGPGEPWHGPEGRLRLERDPGGLPDSPASLPLTVAFREGGERFIPPGSTHHKSLKQWFQEQRVVPWMRDRIPLLFAGDELVAIGDEIVGGSTVSRARTGLHPVWTDHPRIR